MYTKTHMSFCLNIKDLCIGQCTHMLNLKCRCVCIQDLVCMYIPVSAVEKVSQVTHVTETIAIDSRCVVPIVLGMLSSMYGWRVYAARITCALHYCLLSTFIDAK